MNEIEKFKGCQIVRNTRPGETSTLEIVEELPIAKRNRISEFLASHGYVLYASIMLLGFIGGLAAIILIGAEIPTALIFGLIGVGVVGEMATETARSIHKRRSDNLLNSNFEGLTPHQQLQVRSIIGIRKHREDEESIVNAQKSWRTAQAFTLGQNCSNPNEYFYVFKISNSRAALVKQRVYSEQDIWEATLENALELG